MTSEDGEIPCDMCGETMKDKEPQFACRVIDDDAEFPETIVIIGALSEYDYYTICKECYNIAFRVGKCAQWCIKRSEFECLCHERSLPVIKQPED